MGGRRYRARQLQNAGGEFLVDRERNFYFLG
jgi:hypothetical protein